MLKTSKPVIVHNTYLSLMTFKVKNYVLWTTCQNFT